MRTAGALLVTHIAVACLGWANGFIAGSLIQRRRRLELEAWVALSPLSSVIDLSDGDTPYNWVVDGECVEAAR